MKARNVMTVEVTCVSPEEPLARAHELMKQLCVRHLPVTSEGRLCGILSDRDLLRHGHAEEDGRLTLPDVPVGEVMTLEPLSCPPGTSVSRLATLMLENRIDSIPIISLGGHLVGLVTSTDLLALLTQPDQVSDVLPFTFDIRKPEVRPATA